MRKNATNVRLYVCMDVCKCESSRFKIMNVYYRLHSRLKLDTQTVT